MIKALDNLSTRPWHLWASLAFAEFVAVTWALTDTRSSAEIIQRFGAVIVCLAVLFLSVGRISLHFSERHWMAVYKRNYATFQELYASEEARITAQFGEDDVYVHQVRTKNEASLQNLDPDSLQLKLDNVRIGWVVAELSVLIIGTIQWGFGDWILNYHLFCGSKTC